MLGLFGFGVISQRMMDMQEATLKAIRLKGHIGSDRKLEITEDSVELPEGDVEVILLYGESVKGVGRPSPSTLPTLNGKRYLGGSLRREEIYGDNGR
jgi:hypothetical protein